MAPTTMTRKHNWKSWLLALALLCGCGGKETTATVDMQAKLIMGIEQWVFVDCTTGEYYCVDLSTLEPWWNVLSSPDAGLPSPTQNTTFYVDMRADIATANNPLWRNPACARGVVEVLEMRTISETIPPTCGP
jgi:hypothetical protein